MQEFGMNILYIKGDTNVVVDDFSRILMAHHTHKSAYTTMEEDTCTLLCLDLLFISDNTDCFSLDKEDILFPLDPQIVELEQNLVIQDESSTKTRTDINKVNSN